MSLFANDDGSIADYSYNADGIRTGKTLYDTDASLIGNISYTLDGNRIIAENRLGTKIYYTYDDKGAIMGMYYGGENYIFSKNLQGDVIGVYNESRQLVAKYSYNAYGEIMSITDASGVDVSSNATHIANVNPFRYRGYYYDTETGFYYLQSRYYDPVVGRFLNADAFVSTGQGILGNNMFAYCNNNATNMVDDDGFDPIPSWAKRIVDGKGTTEDYAKALSFDPSAWVGSARYVIDKAISIAKANCCTTSNTDSITEFALYDSDRFEDKTPWRDTFLSGEISGPSFDLKERSVGLGSISINGTTGGGEGKYGSLKIFNFGHAEAGLEVKYGNIKAGAFASVWSPDASVNIGKYTIGVGAEICSIGIGYEKIYPALNSI